MLYLSTRGDAARKHFCEILLEGLAPDGGLYLPERYPQVDAATLARWRREGLPPDADLVEYFGTDRMDEWNTIERTAGRQGRFFCQPDGVFRSIGG